MQLAVLRRVDAEPAARYELDPLVADLEPARAFDHHVDLLVAVLGLVMRRPGPARREPHRVDAEARGPERLAHLEEHAAERLELRLVDHRESHPASSFRTLAPPRYVPIWFTARLTISEEGNACHARSTSRSPRTTPSVPRASTGRRSAGTCRSGTARWSTG